MGSEDPLLPRRRRELRNDLRNYLGIVLGIVTSCLAIGLLSRAILYLQSKNDPQLDAMSEGGDDFLTKPFRDQDMLDAVAAALDADARRLDTDRALQAARDCWALLTPREREVVQHVASGLMNKQIADRMGIAEITAKIHRGQAMRKMESRSVAELVRKMEALGVVQGLPRAQPAVAHHT